MELLVLNGANPDIRDSADRLPLHWSTKPASIKPITILLKVYDVIIRSFYYIL